MTGSRWVWRCGRCCCGRFTLFCAPVAFYFAVRHWNSPKQGLIPRSRWRLVLAVVFSLTEMVCWCIFGYYLLTARTGIPF